MIPQDTIERVREATDTAEIIGRFVRLKKRGRNFVGLCPFHSEKTPSFSVNTDKQIYHCFGCGKGGNVFRFLMEHEKMGFVEAVKFLAQKANIHIQDSFSSEQKSNFDNLLFAQQVALDYFRSLLNDSKYTVVREEYLKKSRSITEESIETFQLGLTGESWDGLIKYAKSKSVSEEELVQAGLALRSERKQSHFDRFRQRLMIPIFNLSNKPIAFGGRTLKKGEPAKYINSPETPLYHKSDVLYGLNFTRDSIRDSESVYIVEGYFDLISLWQIGIRNVVASSGTAFTSRQARLLARFASKAFLFFDADSAGQKAAMRSVDALYDAGMDVKVMIPPDGEDPDTIARNSGKETIEQLTEESLGFIQFRLRQFDFASAGIIDKEKLIKEFGSLAHRISDPTRRALFIDESASELRVTPALIEQHRISSKENIEPLPKREYNKTEFQFLSLLLCNPGTIDTAFEQIAPDDFTSNKLARMYSAIMTQYELDGVIDASRLIEHFQDEESISLLTELASLDYPSDTIDIEISDRIDDFAKKKQKRIRSLLKEELIQADALGDKDKAEELLEQIRQYKK